MLTFSVMDPFPSIDLVFRLMSSAGLQQGDPCGPLLFELGIQPLLRQLSALNIEVRFYLDDGILYGKPESLAQALSLIKAFGVKTNLALSVSKCQLWDPLNFCVGHPSADLAAIRTVPSDSGLTVLGLHQVLFTRPGRSRKISEPSIKPSVTELAWDLVEASISCVVFR